MMRMTNDDSGNEVEDDVEKQKKKIRRNEWKNRRERRQINRRIRRRSGGRKRIRIREGRFCCDFEMRANRSTVLIAKF
jgi:hypothetical protein